MEPGKASLWVCWDQARVLVQTHIGVPDSGRLLNLSIAALDLANIWS